MRRFKPGDLVELNPTCESCSDATAQYIKQVLGPPPWRIAKPTARSSPSFVELEGITYKEGYRQLVAARFIHYKRNYPHWEHGWLL